MPGVTKERRIEQATALRAARTERGWEPAELIGRLRSEAAARGVAITADYRGLRKRLRNWETGKQTPDVRYRELLAAVYGVAVSALELPEESEAVAWDAERLGRVFARYHGWVVARIYRKLGDYHLAEDLASETFISAGKGLHLVEPEKDEDGLRPYLAMHVRWTIGTHFKRARIDRETTADVMDPEHFPQWEATGDGSDPERAACERTDAGRLLNDLPTVQRQVMYLSAHDDLNAVDIGRRLDMDPDTVRGIYRQAVAALHLALTGEELIQGTTSGSEIQRARQGRGWTQGQLADEIARHARLNGLDVVAPQSLKVYVSAWEQGRKPVPALYGEILSRVLRPEDMGQAA
ncbi:sigma-70 family RNA polymerase sigma factor [Streptomyces rubrogriseus]|uniref:sigma-70 family RNA polymerase sigma factor n=1 Tax=Streptomyces rubrogriseus TaxID=194673 RepID=UPI003700836A